MSIYQAAANLVNQALFGQMDFVVLRGLDDFARKGGDIDVLVPRDYSRVALSCVAERAVDAGWNIAGVSDIGYLTQICLVQRCGVDMAHRAVKIDLFDGIVWAASGQDPLGSALFQRLGKTLSKAEAIAVTTLLQKMLYAGYLRDRDRKRIEEACPCERIKAFIDDMNLPLTQSDLNRGYLSNWSRWRLRAASAGTDLASIPYWGLSAICRKFRFILVPSAIPGRLLRITGRDGLRRTAVVARFGSILETAGFPRPVELPDTGMGRLNLTWRLFRGETVVIPSKLPESVQTDEDMRSPELQVQLPKNYASSGDDLERVLIALSRQILATLTDKTQV